MALTKVKSGMRTLGAGEVVADNVADNSIPHGKMRGDAAIPASKLAATLDLSGKTVTLPAASVTAHASDFDDNELKDEIALLGFKTASVGSLAEYSLIKQSVDTFTDSTGISSADSANETKVSGYFYGAATNYSGDSSDGGLSTSANVTHTVQNTNGAYDGDMVVKQYSSLTINAGHTMTVNQPCRGLFIYVAGDCTIDGTISMTGKGGNANPNNAGGSDSNAVGAGGLQLGLVTPGGSTSFTNDGTGFNGAGTAIRTAIANTDNMVSNGTVFTMSKIGAAVRTGPTGNDGGYAFGWNGNNGVTGAATISTGSGGTGQIQNDGNSANYSAGDGGGGGAFSAGAGGGGIYANGAYGRNAGDGGSFGGAGGTGIMHGSGLGVGRGAGNPGGTNYNPSNDSRDYYDAEDGVGGIIWLVVGGNLSIGANGLLEAQGKRGGNAYVDGGSSGGGAIMVLHTGTYTVNNTNSTPINCNGGVVNNTSGPTYVAGAGGNGGFHVAQLSRIPGNMTLESTSKTATGTITQADLVATYSDGLGTAVVGTDIKFYVSRNAGTNWTEATMVSQGTTAGHTIITAHDIDIAGQDAGTAMRWKVTTHNQSGSKETRLQAISLGWN